MKYLCVTMMACVLQVGQIEAAQRRAVILDCDLPGHSPALISAIAEQLQGDYQVERIDLPDLHSSGSLATNPPDLLVLPNASAIPAPATPAITAYLQTGGDIIALRAPLSFNPPIRIDGKWIDKHEYLTSQAGRLPPHVLYDFSGPDGFAGWDRVTNHPELKTTARIVPDQPAIGLNAVHVQIGDLQGWDTYQAPDQQPFFPEGHSLTVLAAKGTAKTNSLCIEWQEKDGSRWFATVPLAQHWKQIVIAPEEFLYWSSNPKRGGAGDRFNPANAMLLKVGLAFSHTGAVAGPHEYWLGPMGTAPRTAELEQLIGDFALPALDTLCPSYKMFDCSEVASLVACPWPQQSTSSADAVTFALASRIRAPHPRAGGGGYDKGRAWRWLPLVEARTRDGEWRGTPATLLVHADGPYKGGVWASCGIDDEEWYLTNAGRNLIRNVARWMQPQVAILDGGADKYTYFEDQPMRLGARVVNFGKDPAEAIAELQLVNRTDGAIAKSYRWPFRIAPGQVADVSEAFSVERWPDEGYECRVTLTVNGQVHDEVHHKVHCWKPKPLAERKYMTIRDGNFILDGKRWRAHGINYMPTSGIASEDYPYFEDWTGPRGYDPEVIQRDLEKIKQIGYNSVSVFTDHRLIKWQNTVDLLRRCEQLGLMVNLSMRPGTPMDFQWPKIKEMIEALRLADSDALFAYDLAWEPHFGRHENRVIWDAHWAAWIVERYDSIENAEKDWEFKVPRNAAGQVTNPGAEQVTTDGPWRRMVAAYRRFLDTLLYQKYEAARRLVRGIDPHHFVSFRMTEAGNPTCQWGDMMPYDFPYLVNGVDFLAPEAYGRIGDAEAIKPGWFELEYGRWADPAKPFVWAEQGLHAWSTSVAGNTPDLLARQADFYREFYRMMIASGADGIYSWWYPGGFRPYENSDYGVVNPDGSDRPVTKVIRELAQPFLQGADPKPIDTWIEFDRDPYPDGIVGAYRAVNGNFWKAIGEGKTPGLRTAGTGTNSKTCPRLAVGNTPCNGQNPPKYLDAALDVVEYQADNGQWMAIKPGDVMRIGRRGTASLLRLRICITNLGEAEWVSEQGNPAAPESMGAVFLHASVADQANTFPLAANVPTRGSLEHVPIILHIPDALAEGDVMLTFEGAGLGRFGERFRFQINRTNQ